MKALIYICGALLLFITSACSKEKRSDAASDKQNHTISKPSPQLYKQWHDVCLSGKTKDIDLQIEKFEAQLKKNPKDYLSQVYLGSACALRAKASFWGPSKLKFLRRGQKLMDSAVESAPNDHRVRMVRAIGCYKVPKKFKRRTIAIQDCKTLVPAAKNKQNDLQTNERQVILYYAYLTYKEEGVNGAEKIKASCHKLAPDSKYGKLTR